MISVKEAHEIIRSFVPAPQVEVVSHGDAAGRVLAQEIKATFGQPRFDNSAMDGFAVRWKDTRNASGEEPVMLSLKGVISAGTSARIHLQNGECAQVMTGAPLPSGADAVVMVEYSSGFESGVEVQIFRPAVRGEHIRFRGEEVEEGEPVIPAGSRVEAVELGVLATFGYREVKVNRQPELAIIATGKELKNVDEHLSEGEIYNSNLPLLKDLACRAGAEVAFAEAVGDDPEIVRAHLEKVCKESDVVVTSGGVSMGRYDYIRPVLEKIGAAGHFWGVRQKPGKPMYFGTAEKVLIFGLPGNTVSAFICFMEYVWPACEQWMGLESQDKLKATLTTPFPRDPEKHRFLPGNVWVEGESLKCAPTKKLGSHMLTSVAGANSILESPPGEMPLPEGDSIVVSVLPWKSIGSEP